MNRYWSDMKQAWCDRDGSVIETYEAIAASRGPSPIAVGDALGRAFAYAGALLLESRLS